MVEVCPCLLSILFICLIIMRPVVEMVIWLMLEGHTCDKESRLLVLGLYQQELGPPGLVGYRVRMFWPFREVLPRVLKLNY